MLCAHGVGICVLSEQNNPTSTLYAPTSSQGSPYGSPELHCVPGCKKHTPPASV